MRISPMVSVMCAEVHDIEDKNNTIALKVHRSKCDLHKITQHQF